MPANPRKDDPFFPVEENFFPPDWYQGAIFAGAAEDRTRHVLFFTPTMKRQLEHSKTWFMDATFYFVDDPIKQLFTINGFIKNDKQEMKPLLFCCMTRRRAADSRFIPED
ncbi:hypothetical protein GHT06_022523 [Daphnia sinensis]|uniref:Uncharacterized protein n=1 Tax=Daphnia sinensis TaxID=1820382 RepID=A0AAD5KH61_9CRUS|nr:hypothetical protein GHT06_022523 [Daphnia sinensis]